MNACTWGDYPIKYERAGDWRLQPALTRPETTKSSKGADEILARQTSAVQLRDGFSVVPFERI